MALKILPIEESDGTKRVHPEIMELLLDLAAHRDYCERCENAMQTGSGQYCHIGADFILRLADRPDCEFIEE